MSEIPNVPLNVLVLEHDLAEQKRCCDLIRKFMPNVVTYPAEFCKDALDIVNSVNIDAAVINKDITDAVDFKSATIIKKIEKYMILPMLFTAEKEDPSVKDGRIFPPHFSFITRPYTDDKFIELISELLQGIEINKHNIIGELNDKQFRNITITSNGNEYSISVSDILYAEVLNRSICLYLKEETIQEINMTLRELIDYIDDEAFFRCHKSFAANAANVHSKQISGKRIYNLYFDASKTQYCPLSKTYYHAFKEKFSKTPPHGINSQFVSDNNEKGQLTQE
jgi:DNA-binding LytR/AlgR family response regulator